MSALATTVRLPRIVRFLGVDDAPGASCPHCGAEGRYILRFQVEDGRSLGAMRGCAKLFPASQVAHEHLRLTQKAERYAKLGWKPNRADSEAMDACERFFAREVSESYALGVIKSAKRANQMRGAYGGGDE